MRVTLMNRPVRLNTTPSAATLASLLTQQEGVIAGATRYGFTDRMAASAFIGDSIEADFAAGVYRQGYVQSDQMTMLPGWTFSRTGAATAESAGGGVQSFASGQPRITDRGLLMERAATNYVRNSRDLTAGYWARRNAVSVTVVPGQTRPDGTPGANLISNLSGGGGANDIYQMTSATPGARYEPSFDIKRVSVAGVISFENPAGGGSWSVDLALCSDGWDRVTRHHPAVTVNAEFVGSVGGLCGVFWVNPGGGALSFYVDNCQIEAGSVSTSRIVTGVAEASRGSDASAVNINSAGEGAVFVEFELPESLPSTSNAGFSWSNGVNQFLGIYRTSYGPLIATLFNANGSIAITSTAYTGQGRIRAVLGWGDGKLYLTVLGVDEPSIPLGVINPAISALFPGRDGLGQDHLNSYVRRILVSRRLPTAAQRIAMTEG